MLNAGVTDQQIKWHECEREPANMERWISSSTSSKRSDAVVHFSITIMTAGSTFFCCPILELAMIQRATNRLFKNNRDGTFTDVTKQAGLFKAGWAFGVCVGDYDSDGFDDLFVTERNFDKGIVWKDI